jgi:hypothetical protein
MTRTAGTDQAVSDRVFFTMLAIFALAMVVVWWAMAQLLT